MSSAPLSEASSDNKDVEILHNPQCETSHTILNTAIGSDSLEPIAVIGLDLKFPQDAVSPDSFWQLLVEGRSALTEIPEDRFNIDAFYHSDATRNNTLNIRGGHFIREDIAAFDAPFFSISAVEASSMDPQQRGLLECSYKALENAGVSLAEITGSNTSVHVGSFSREYETVLLRDPELQAKYMATGTGTAMLANRLSWFFNLVGPSIAIDTACSSSLLALHLACQSLRSGESTMGLVAGCNLLFNPDLIIPMTNLNFLSADSICYSFDHRANGYSRGEGFGVIVVKSLSKALQDGNTIRAIIRATGTNQDGRTPGITQPSSLAQERLIRKTYKAGGLDLETTRFFEAHGTGTPVGDPLEASAIGAVFSSQRSKEDPLYVGAVKSNIGHLEGASGIAGLIKSVLVLERGIVPPNIWFERPNPKILPDDWNIKFPTSPTPWPSDGLRRASVNSFGFGGSNVHIVLEDAYHYLTLRNLVGNHHTVEKPPRLEVAPAHFKCQQSSLRVIEAPPCEINLYPQKPTPKLLVWSASDEGGLKRIATLYSGHLVDLSQAPVNDQSRYFEDFVYTVCTKRSSLSWKSFAVAASTVDLQRRLKDGLSRPIRSNQAPRLAFVFTGQGAQWCGMGMELLTFSIFRQSLENANKFFQTLGCKWGIFDELFSNRESSKINTPAFCQPVCTALQVGLVDLLRSWGIYPSAVVGHSSGEIAAAYCTGSISQESAWKIAYYRGTFSAEVASRTRIPGAMMSVGLSKADIQPFLAELGTGNKMASVTVGCINSSDNVTVTGAEEQIEVLKVTLERHQVFTRKLKVGVAYHSIYMDEIALEYERSLGNIDSGCYVQDSSTVSFFSTVSGEIIRPERLRESEYWIKNLTLPVQFLGAVTSMLSRSSSGSKNGPGGAQSEAGVINHLIEIGPHSTLQGPIRDILQSIGRYQRTGYSSLLSRGMCALTTSLTTAGQLYCLGYRVDLVAVNCLRGQRNPHMLVDLPGYPFNHSQRYWLESRISKDFRFRRHPPHELLGTTVRDWNTLEPRWRHFIRESENPWIKDHKINGILLYPASGMLAMAIEAMRQLQGPEDSIKGYNLKEVEFLKPLEIVEGHDGTETSFVLRPCTYAQSKTVWYNFRLHSYACDTWVENCRGFIGVESPKSQDEVDGGREDTESLIMLRQSYADTRARCSTPVTIKDFYEKLSAFGYGFGPCFRTLTDIYCNENGEATSLIKPRDWTTKIPIVSIAKHVIHPTALDGIFQTIFPGLARGGKIGIPTLVPTKIHRMWVSNMLLHQAENDNIKIYSKSGNSVLRIANSTIVGLNVVTDEARVVIKGLQTTAVADTSLPSPNQLVPKRICYNLELQPDLDLLSNEHIFEYCSSTSSSLVADGDEVVEEVELACFLSINKTLATVSQGMLAHSKPHLVKHLAWMKHQVERYKDGLVLHGKPEWEGLVFNLEYQDSLFARTEMSNPEGRLYNAVAKNLTRILTGETDALGLLFSGTLMDQYYHWSIEHGNSFAKVAAYLDAFVHKNPDCNILEIGAGTGSGTESVMDVLTRHGEGEHGQARYRHFTFTDISPSFFEKAREKFASQTKRMTFKVLDISSDPGLQGFETGIYDLIIAVNVLHATPNLDITLKNTRKLMKPGAKLLLFEICNLAILRTGFIFGLLPGWWLGTENNRKWGPLLSEEDWHGILTRNGFSGTDVILRDNPNERMHLGSAILTTASEQVNGHRTSDLQEPLIFAAEGSTLHRNVACQVRLQLLSLGIPGCEVVDLRKVSSHTVAKRTCISLMELESPLLSGLEANQFTNLQKVVVSAKALLWITGGRGESAQMPELSLVSGFARCIRSEYSNLNFVTLALENTTRDESSLVRRIVKVFEAMMGPDQGTTEKEYIERNGLICISRIIEANYLNHHVLSKTLPSKAEAQELKAGPIRPLTLNIASPGLLNTIQFVTDDLYDQPLGPGEVEVEVRATGLMFRDIAVLLNQASSDQIGTECAGVVTRVGEGLGGNLKAGDRVCCMPKGSYKTYARTVATLVAKIPDQMSFPCAAAIPMAYCTAYYSLYNLGGIQIDTTILIHCGAGSVGQAAIQLAKLVTKTSNILVTVGSNVKKRLLMDRYGILEDHIFSSRSLTFADGVKRITHNRGVDIILNSLGGEKLRRSLECVAPFGHFVDIGLKDVDSFGSLPILPFSKSITFSSVNLLLMIRDAPDILGGILGKVMTLLSCEKITPEAVHVYSYSKLEDAFRLLQSGKNLGKVVAVPRETDVVPVVPDYQRIHEFDPDATYLISGGLGGLGRSITRWMVARGAKNFILLSRSGPSKSPSRLFVSDMRARGIHIETPTCDISDESSLANILAECGRLMPPIKGCIQAAMVLRDAIFENMKLDDFKAALRPKVQGSWNLHAQLPKGMDFFILLSSLNGILGSRSQSNYGAGNSYEDALAQYRIKLGEKAVSLDIGLVKSVGFVAERQEIIDSQLLTGLSGIEESQLHAVLSYHCNPALPLPSPLKSQVMVGIETPAALRAKGLDKPYWLAQPICRHLFQMDDDIPSGTFSIDAQSDYRTLLQSAKSLPAAKDVVCSGVKEKLAKMLSIPVADIDGHNSITSYGTDSLVAVELRTWLSKEMGVDVAIFEILSNVGLGAFSEMAAQRSLFVNLADDDKEARE